MSSGGDFDWEAIPESKRTKAISGGLLVIGIIVVSVGLGRMLGMGLGWIVMGIFILLLSRQLFWVSRREERKEQEAEGKKTTAPQSSSEEGMDMEEFSDKLVDALRRATAERKRDEERPHEGGDVPFQPSDPA